MADRNGYIGRAPGDSSVTVARQVFSPTGVQTNFTFASGYVPGYLDVYLNGAKLIVAQDFTATDGSVVGLTSSATNGDVLEAVAFKAFNAAAVSQAADFTVTGNQTNNGTLTVTGGTTLSNLNVTGILTAGSFSGDGSGLTGVASTDFIITGTAATFNNTTQLQNVQLVGVTTGLNVSGVATFASNITAVDGTFSGNVSVGGTLTYEDVTNVDSVGLITARNGINVTGGDVTIGSATTVGLGTTAFFGDSVRAVFGDGEDLEIYHNGGTSYIRDIGVGSLLITTNGTQIRLRNGTEGEDMANFIRNGAVELYYDNSKKFETTNTGAVVTGILTATSFEGSGANLTDLPASGDANDVTASLFN